MYNQSQNNPINEAILKYLSEKIVEDIPADNHLKNDLCKAIVGYPVIDPSPSFS